MKKALSIILIITLIISMCSGVLCADEVVFEGEEGFEGDVIEEETVFEEPANEGEIEDVTEDSAVFHEEYISEDYSFDDNAYEITMYEDGQNEEIISSEEAATTFEDENILSKGSDLSEDVIISEETITDDPSFANAVNSGTYGDNITWKLSGVEDNLILTLTGSGPMKNYAKNSSIPWNKRRDEIVRVILSEGITSIGKGAFCCIPKLTSVKIPNSVTKIEFGAFEKCTNLKNVIIADKGIEYIGNQAFNGCESLRSFNLPDTLTEIGNYAFMNCTSLSSIILPDSLTDIGGDTFAGCYGLRSVTLPQEITKIDGGIFSDCTSLKSIVIPNGVKMIGLDAFSNCISLTSIIIPNSVTSLSGFSGCTGLTSIKIPNSVTSIEENAFSNCSKLTEVEIPDSVKYIEERAFEECSNLTGITIPNSVTSIGKLAFRSCSSLTSITIPNSVMSIGNFAFEDCSSLTSITIPSSVTWIGYDAFYGCTNLVIYGENGSYAEIYAKENNIPFIGNTDNDPTTPPNTEKAKQLLELLKKPKEYNNDLAILASEMSQKTYSSREEIENFYKVEYGCSKCIVNNYATPISATISAYSIAKIKSADNTEILIIAAQGTTRLYEIVKDATAGTKTTCEGKAVFDIVEDFYISIVNGLDQITENNKKYKILLTGHSLGGAAVNLLAARIINGDINSRLSKTISAEVFCYPFAPINCIKSDKLIEKGFENIHNIYNVLDTFSPLQYGGYLITGMGTGVGKFGKLHSYLYEYRDPGKIEGDEVEILKHENHEMHHYADSIKNGYVLTKKYPLEKTTITKNNISITSVQNVTYNNGSLVYPKPVVKYNNQLLYYNRDYYITAANRNIGLTYANLIGKGLYEGEVVFKFSIIPNGTSISVLSSIKGGFSVKWNNQPRMINGYHIQYSTSKDFKKDVGNAYIKSATSRRETISKLKSKKKYYVRIRTYGKVNGKKYFSNWSNSKSVVTK